MRTTNDEMTTAHNVVRRGTSSWLIQHTFMVGMGHPFAAVRRPSPCTAREIESPDHP